MKMKPLLLFLPLLVLLAGGVGGENPRKFKPYEILGVQRSSSTQEIKKAFKRLVKELHPDKNHAPDANDRLEHFYLFLTYLIFKPCNNNRVKEKVFFIPLLEV